MNIKSRIQIYPNTEIKGRAVIAGEPAALRALAKALVNAANSPTGIDTVRLYEGNGHDFEILTTTAVSEEEWQNMPKDSSKISSVELYDELKTKLAKSKEPFSL